jgi:hypothetical protein
VDRALHTIRVPGGAVAVGDHSLDGGEPREDVAVEVTIAGRSVLYVRTSRRTARLDRRVLVDLVGRALEEVLVQ